MDAETSVGRRPAVTSGLDGLPEARPRSAGESMDPEDVRRSVRRLHGICSPISQPRHLTWTSTSTLDGHQSFERIA